jgi:glycosyltransferase involved in cell wall biosynthesis
MPAICLNMIVRNEAAVIGRCLESVRPFISSWAISDTGSTDGTPEIIWASLAGIPGELSKHQWMDFSYNRNLALERAMGKADYILLIDADMVLNVETIANGHSLENLTEDAYFIRFSGAMDYSVIRLISTKHRWEYKGAVHEYISSTSSSAPVILSGVSITHHEDGSARADKFEREIRLLTAEFEKEPDNPRTVFYLAQSYRDAGKPHEAMQLYERRVGMRGWDEETWYSLYQLGRLQEAILGDFRIGYFTLLQAYQIRPTRLEPIYPIVRFFNEHKQYHLAYNLARLITEVGYPPDILFVERPIYEYLLAYEYAICCHQTGRTEESIRIIQLLELEGKIPLDLLQTLKNLGSSQSGSLASSD